MSHGSRGNLIEIRLRGAREVSEPNVRPTVDVGDYMSDQDTEVRLVGIVRAERYDPAADGKPFLGAAVECSDGKVWVVDYSEQSPFRLFAGQQVVVSGEPCQPEGQHLIEWGGTQRPGHFRVSILRLVEMSPGIPFAEIGRGRALSGRFQRDAGNTETSPLTFVGNDGEVFLVANDPANVNLGCSVNVWAYQVQPYPATPGRSRRHLWVIAPCSIPDLKT